MRSILIVLMCIFFLPSSAQKSRKSDILIQKKYTIKGNALNSKSGAILSISDTLFYLIDGLQNWPDKKYNKQLTVTGDLYKTPAPVFIPEEEGLVEQGIPVKDSVEYKKYEYQLLLKNVVYK